MNYEIIKDISILEKFVDWLPEITQDETYYICLFARSKYCKGINHINTDKAQLKRFTSDRSRIIDKIKQLECPLGSYKQKQNTVPQEALALYINPNPRSNIKAAKNGLIRLAHLVTEENHGYNFHQEMLSEVQKAKSRMVYMDFDIDVDKSNLSVDTVYSLIEQTVNKEAVHLLESRGGYHLLIEIQKVHQEFKNKWYDGIRRFQQNFSTDILNRGDSMIPIPGCTQGNFIPHFINFK